MKFDERDIGGREVGPVQMEIIGPRIFSEPHIGTAKNLLGSLKQRMGFNELKIGNDHKEMPKKEYKTTLLDALLSGALDNEETTITVDAEYASKTFGALSHQTTIDVSSIKGEDGQADIDSIKIVAESSFVGKHEEEKTARCTGYILQFFAYDFGSYDMTISLPSNKELTNNTSTFDSSLWEEMIYNGYKDNSAAYIPVGAGHQVIILADNLYTKKTEGKGPMTATPAPYSQPALPPAHKWVTSLHTGGICGYIYTIPDHIPLPQIWSINASTPPQGFGCTYSDITTPWPHETPELPGGALDTDVAAYIGGWHVAGPVGGCAPDQVSYVGLRNYKKWPATLASAVNSASSTAYSTLLAKPFFRNTKDQNYCVFPYTDSSPMFRRDDSHGFLGGFGLKMESSGITFTEKHEGNGELFAVMVPSGKALKYSLSSAYQSKITASGSRHETPYSNVGACGTGNDLGPTFETRANVVVHNDHVANSVSKFGVPVVVEIGAHKINVNGMTGDYKIHLLMESDDGTLGGYNTVNITNVKSSDTVLIMVGDIETGLPPSSVVSVQRG